MELSYKQIEWSCKHLDNDCNVNSTDTRIMKEIFSLYSQTKHIHISETNNIHTIEFTFNNHNYKFLLSKKYPFTIPTEILINNTNYKILKQISSQRFLVILKKKFGYDCLCCTSMLCGDNWSPAKKIADIVNEIEQTIVIKRKIFLYALCDSIKIKNNCEFAYIEQYLF
jgi:hypothetical protein